MHRCSLMTRTFIWYISHVWTSCQITSQKAPVQAGGGESGALTLSLWEVIQTSLPFPLAHLSVHINRVQLLQHLAFYICMCMHPDGHENKCSRDLNPGGGSGLVTRLLVARSKLECGSTDPEWTQLPLFTNSD